MPTSRKKFWIEKLSANWERDKKNIGELLEQGWRVMVVWACALDGKQALPLDEIGRRVQVWLTGTAEQGEIPARLPRSISTPD